MQLSHALAGSEPDELRRLVHLEAEDGFVYPVSPHISPYLPVSPHVSGPRSGRPCSCTPTSTREDAHSAAPGRTQPHLDASPAVLAACMAMARTLTPSFAA